MEVLLYFLGVLFLFVGSHFICDYVLQTDAIAVGKNRQIEEPKFGVQWYYWMAAHCYTHGVGVMAVTYVFTESLWLSIYFAFKEFFAHWVIDTIKCSGRVSLHTDQVLHLTYKLFFSVGVVIYMVIWDKI